MRATTAFNKILVALCVTVREVTFEGGDLVLAVRSTRRQLRCLCGWSTRSTYDRSMLNKAVGDTIRWSNLTRQGLALTKQEATDLRWAMLKKGNRPHRGTSSRAGPIP